MLLTLKKAEEDGKTLECLMTLHELAETEIAQSNLAKLAKCSTVDQLRRNINLGELKAVALKRRKIKSNKQKKEYYYFHSHPEWLEDYLNNFFREN
ncbi:MAG: hypothetical protein GY870_11270 [archaeon]|nr:hypothetical protein [archaeon]